MDNKEVQKLVEWVGDWLLKFHEEVDNHSDFTELYYQRSARELLSGFPDLALRDRTKPVKYDLMTNTNYIAIIPLASALKGE